MAMVTFKVETKTAALLDITEQVKDAVAHSGIEEGLCVLGCTGTGVGILLSSNCDTLLHEDILDDLQRIFPSRKSYACDGDLDEAAACTKSAVTGPALDVIVHKGEPLLGANQSIYLADYVGGKVHNIFAKCIGTKQEQSINYTVVHVQ